jgi:hypothetical protein
MGGRIVLKSILKKQDGISWSGFICLGLGTSEDRNRRFIQFFCITHSLFVTLISLPNFKCHMIIKSVE